MSLGIVVRQCAFLQVFDLRDGDTKTVRMGQTQALQRYLTDFCRYSVATPVRINTAIDRW